MWDDWDLIWLTSRARSCRLEIVSEELVVRNATTSSIRSETRNDGDTLRAGIVGLVEEDG